MHTSEEDQFGACAAKRCGMQRIGQQSTFGGTEFGHVQRHHTLRHAQNDVNTKKVNYKAFHWPFGHADYQIQFDIFVFVRSLQSLNISWTSLETDSITELSVHVNEHLQRLNIAGCRKTMTDTSKWPMRMAQ